ncbi:T9SS type A sorting domain-containing protein [Flavobacterium sp. XS1P32]|uniref:T9SS type A sorting domain-containing protein n=1 Tax=unclassified Flavobacterium TaxID=196869 RepID=UPI003AAB2A1A
MKKIILLFMLFCLPKLMAQNATVASGGNATGSGGSSSFTVGQVFYTNAVGSNGSINQGAQQPVEIFALGTTDFPEISLTMSVYPNPTTALVILSIANYNSENINYQLFDLNGRVIQSNKILQKETQISLQNLSKAIYFLTVSDNNKSLKTFKIIKN